MPKGYHHLTRDQRCQLYTLKARGDSMIFIAKELKMSRSSLYREISRNSGELGYRYEQADRKAKKRRYEASHRSIKMRGKIISILKEKLKTQWSPEQISGWMKKRGYSKGVSYETIYKYIWQDKRLGGTLYKELRHCGKKYNTRKNGKMFRGRIRGRIGVRKARERWGNGLLRAAPQEKRP